MRLPIVFDGTEWRKATMEEYKNVIVNVPVYGKANWLFPNVWELPVVDTNTTTGSKVVKCGRSMQFRFSCTRTTDTAKAVRAYKLALDKDSRAGVQFNYVKSGCTFVFESSFCGSASGLKRFQAFIDKLASITSIKALYVRVRQEDTNECSTFKKFPYNSLTLGLIRYLRDTLDIKGYNKVKVSELNVVPDDNIYGIKIMA